MNRTEEYEQKKAEFLKLVSQQLDELTMNGRFPIVEVKTYPVTGSPIVNLGKVRGKYVMRLDRMATVTLD